MTSRSSHRTDSLFAEASLATRFFLRLRAMLTPYDSIAAALPVHGAVLDLGCGHGILTLALAGRSSQRTIIGIDHDPDRVRLARLAAQKMPAASRPTFEVGDIKEYLASLPSGAVAGIAMIDMLHYFDGAGQISLISHAARVLAPGGVLVVREIDSDDRIRGGFNRLYERIATGVGFTRSVGSALTFRGKRSWTSLMENAGFAVRSELCGAPFLADVLFIASRAL